MNYTIGIVTVFCCFFMAIGTLDLKRVQKCRYLYSQLSENLSEGIQFTSQQILFFSIVLTFAVGISVWRLTVMVHETLNFLKMSSTLVLLTGCACVDTIEHRIPNLFTGLTALLAALFLITGFVTAQVGAYGYLNSSLFAAAASAAVLTIGSVLSHHGIGIGDIKLISALGLMGGVYITGGTLFFATLLCALFSIWLLITRKKTMKESVPFGPFILFGYMLTICLLKF